MMALKRTKHNTVYSEAGVTQSVLDQQMGGQKVTSQTKPDAPTEHPWEGAGPALRAITCLCPSVADGTVPFHSFISMGDVGLVQQLAQPCQGFCPRGKVAASEQTANQAKPRAECGGVGHYNHSLR